jgi:hypothetical protein
MAVEVSNESIRAVITLVFLGVEFSSSWADNTVFTVPEWEFRWALASLVSSAPNSSVSLLIGRAFALSGSWVDLSWGFTWNVAVTSVEGWVIEMTLWA